MKKINVEKSIIYRYDRLSDLVKCVEMLGKEGYFSDYSDFKHFDVGTLVEIRFLFKGSNYPFMTNFGDWINGENVGFKYFMPNNTIVFEEKPFGVEEDEED